VSDVSVDASAWREGVLDLRQAVQAAGFQLDATAYDRVYVLFQRFANQSPTLEQMRSVAPEYGQDEFLRCVDREGGATQVSAAILNDYDRVHRRQPQYALWFRAAESTQGRVLLIARWLCHLAGFRHRTVHLMLDHPALSGHVLVQVRGVHKEESPACFDLPVAGHVPGLSTVEGALQRECEEELGLDLDQIVGLRRLGSYDRAYLEDWPGFWTAEHHTVFHGRLAREAWLAVHAPDDEVAGVAIFPIARLRALAARFPDRVAFGLRRAPAVPGASHLAR
jgi:8-oxo-dGTP pyrophosphatase MutT (NUDIX family)